MALHYGFYDSINGDRKYSSDDFMKIFDGNYSDGIYANIGDEFHVAPYNNTNIIQVGTGRAWLLGHFMYSDSPTRLIVSEGSMINPRWDTVVLETNLEERKGDIKIVSGMPDENPSYPELINTELIKQMPLAHIYVDKTTTTITDDNITNLIGSEQCPYVKLIDTIIKKTNETTIISNLSFMPSYLAFCGNVNANQVEAALGKNNEDEVKAIGYAMTKYAKYLGDDYVYRNLPECQTLNEILMDDIARSEFLNHPILWDYFKNFEYVRDKVANYFKQALSNISTAQMMLESDDNGFMPFIRNNTDIWKSVFSDRSLITTEGTGEIVVPEGKKVCIYIVIGQGGLGNTYTSMGASGNGGSAGEYNQGVIDLFTTSSIPYEFSTAANTFNGVTSNAGKNNNYQGVAQYTREREIGKLVQVSQDGGRGRHTNGNQYSYGGEGGYGGGNATASSSGTPNGGGGGGYGGGAGGSSGAGGGSSYITGSAGTGPKQIGEGAGGGSSGPSVGPGVIMYCFF